MSKVDEFDEDDDVVAKDVASFVTAMEGIPQQIEAGNDQAKESKEVTANCMSQALFSWVTPMFVFAHRKWNKEKKETEDKDLWAVTPWDNTWVLSQQFEEAVENWQKRWTKKNKGKTMTEKEMNQMLTHALWKIIGPRLISAGFLKLLNTIIQFSFPVLLNQVLQTIAKLSVGNYENEWEGYLWTAGFGIALLARSITYQAFFFRAMRCGWQVRSVLTTAVYRKTLRISASARQSMSVGEIVNLMQLDATKLERFVAMSHNLWDGLLQVLGYLGLLFFYLGWPIFLSMGMIVLASPIVILVFTKIVGIQKKIVVITDSRVKLTNEVLQGMSAIKMAAWENSYLDAINVFRKQEVVQLKRAMWVLSYGFAFMLSLPTFIAVVVLAVYAWRQNEEGGVVDAPTLFTAISTFALLQGPLLIYPNTLALLSIALVSRRRLATFFSLDDITNNTITNDADEESGNSSIQSFNPNSAVEIVDGTFTWSKSNGLGNKKTVKKEEKQSKKAKKSKVKDEDPSEEVSITIPGESSTDNVNPSRIILENINLSIKKGSLTAIIGSVGSGKSSLVNAIIKEMNCASGAVHVDGSVAFAAQTAWIFNDTIRENILFGEPMDENRYRKVVKACQLSRDFEILEDGDMTMIGERGINLSGGQKQRISVARAAYSRNEIVVLDDPLSALDPEVARALFTQCISKFMKGRTIVLVTNQLYFLPDCDQVVVLDAQPDRPGRIVESGRYSQLLKSGLDFSKLMEKFHGRHHDGEEGQGREESHMSAADAEGKAEEDDGEKLRDEEGEDLMQSEERNAGAVKLGVYSFYIRSGGVCLFAFSFFIFILNEVATVLNRAWVTIWTDDSSYQNYSLPFYLFGYGATALIVTFFLFVALVSILYFGLQASKRVHNKMAQSVLRAPMSFFDTTPIGRMVSRFSKDLNQLDNEIPQILMNCIFLFLAVMFALATVGFSTPWFLVAVPILFLVYLRILNYYRPLLRSAKRLESISRSPIYSHFGETLSGLSTIRAYGASSSFMEENSLKVNSNIKSWYLMRAMECWLGIRLDFLGSALAIIAAVLAVLSAKSGTISAGLAGLSLNFAISLTAFLEGTVIAFATLEAGVNAVERILHYSKNLEQEAPFESSNPPPPSWPSTGEIQITDLQMRYRENTPLVLKGVSLTIQGGHRIGICGRTGSGKSSMLVALLRLVEPIQRENGDGSVFIDGIDVSKIGLHELRSKVSIVPQNPVMFSGTVRSNLDPFKRFSDDDLWQALERCKVRGVVEECGGLDGEVSEYGENFSQGQRQLLCFARSILVQNRILLLDEATSSVDYETDVVIQETIRSSFSGCTILTIAHRLNTVIDSDKILVLDAGEVAEYDSPHALLSDSGSVFSGMVDELGSAMSAKLRKAAKSKRISRKLLESSN